MQTFLPYPDFEETAKVLDYRRLGKQRVETMQIYNAMHSNAGWSNHPATRMWRNNSLALLHYGKIITLEWIKRGYKDNMLKWFEATIASSEQSILYPQWLGDEKFHGSHRSALLFKDLKHYSQFNWADIPKIEYVWPVS